MELLRRTCERGVHVRGAGSTPHTIKRKAEVERSPVLVRFKHGQIPIEGISSFCGFGQSFLVVVDTFRVLEVKAESAIPLLNTTIPRRIPANSRLVFCTPVAAFQPQKSQ
ncbi:hypothetical protein I7I51_02745 [Histoplasma capsulatum]|uniref:Uncharacterized protein n=1 Tax=Ajellomyces capsulatus TaxID=5037 RepID=A0A8A1MR71_AJECA|nr:predicted protein [Histoplasma mississippiense (nom. inval.)]EDN05006.1 predicted protein [Histoplasma mississippiense (nom. inval.)]QSS66557.1 hypothetical protein I7I51_02745 [Histoplasma capsulatum]